MQTIYRIIIGIILFFSFLNVLAMLAINVSNAIHVYVNLFHPSTERPGVEVMEIVDGMLLVLLLLIMNVGFLKLFLPQSKLSKMIDLPWLKMNSFSQLKHLLIETILTTLVVIFAATVVKEQGRLQWIDIIIPLSVLLLALTVKFVKDDNH
jgi:uncharacterized membrane protein YqhA